MAKKRITKKKVTRAPSPSADAAGALSSRLRATDERTLRQLTSLASAVRRSALAGAEPSFDVPVRSLSNTIYNEKKRIVEKGDGTSERPLFDLKSAKKFMQTLLLSGGVKELIAQGKTSSLRGMYYTVVHTIAGTKEKTLADQDESDAILEDLEVLLGSLREELHIYADVRGALVGNLTLIDTGDEIDCRRMGSGGYAIPSICEPGVIEFGACEADFVLHVEKGTVWRRFNEDRFWKKHNCILTHGAGQPTRGVRRLLRRFHDELKLPIYCLLDCDPWGHYIYSVIKQGSINLAFESQRMAVPDAKFLGIRAIDYERYQLSDDVQLTLNERDVSRARQIAEYPWFASKKPWQLEIKKMLANGFKMEVEALITKDISYVTEVYVPDRLKQRDWLE